MTSVCSTCKTSCLTCDNGYNCTDCDTTNKFRTLINAACVCIDKYYENAGNCEPCNPTCKTCATTVNKCTTCSSTANRVINSGTNTCDCKLSFFSLTATT